MREPLSNNEFLNEMWQKHISPSLTKLIWFQTFSSNARLTYLDELRVEQS